MKPMSIARLGDPSSSGVRVSTYCAQVAGAQNSRPMRARGFGKARKTACELLHVSAKSQRMPEYMSARLST